ncbi:MAG: hypothetical protein ACYDD1_11770 [Caulobacteraceae bacterium]
MIHAAIFGTADSAARASLLITGSPADVARNTPPGGCWRLVPAGCASTADVPPLGKLAPVAGPNEGRAR